MPTDCRPNAADAARPAGQGSAAAEADMISLREILVMILRHRWPIAIFVLLVTAAAGVFFLCQPRVYMAEGCVQVIAPVSLEGRVDQGLFETMIVSHLQRISSAFLAKNTATELQAAGITITPLELSRRVKITRPPKTDLIRLMVTDKSPETALAVIRLWIGLYQESIQKNNIRTALSQVRLMSKLAQSEAMEKQAAADQLKAQALQTSPLVTVSRAVDDRQLWNDLTQAAATNAEVMKKLSEVHIKGQELNAEYIHLKNMLFAAEQVASVAKARRDFYREVERLLEARANTGAQAPDAAVERRDSEADLYVQTILKSTEVIQFGEPGLLAGSRGALKKTALVFAGALLLACLVAYVEEWGRGLLSS